jgi:thymidine phosphorylase
MDEPLGTAVGNAVEVIEAVDVLRGHGPEEVRRMTCALAGEMLRLGGITTEAATGEQAAAAALASGAALSRFDAMVRAHGGRLDLDRDDCGLTVAPVASVVQAPRDAWLAAVDGTAIGFAVVDLGGGRARKDDRIDPRVGLRWRARIGARLDRGAPVVEILAAPHADLEAARSRLQAALTWSDTPIDAPPWILGRREG